MTVEVEYLQNIAAMLRRACGFADTLHTRTGTYAGVQQEMAQLSTRISTLLAAAQADEMSSNCAGAPQTGATYSAQKHWPTLNGTNEHSSAAT